MSKHCARYPGCGCHSLWGEKCHLPATDHLLTEKEPEPPRPGRKTPYTDRGISRVRCFRCDNKAMFQWQICSDNNLYRPICLICDFALNKMVLQFMKFPDWEEKHQVYVNKKLKDLNLTRPDWEQTF
jgi:hypothetical protein